MSATTAAESRAVTCCQCSSMKTKATSAWRSTTGAMMMISERAKRPFGIRSPRPRVKRRHTVRIPRIGWSAAWAVAVIARSPPRPLYAVIVRR